MCATAVKKLNILSNIKNMLQGDKVSAVLARGASGSFIVTIVSAALVFVVQLVLARVLGVSQYGIYILALTWIQVLSVIAILGMDTMLLRYIAAYKAQGEWNLFRGILEHATKYVALSSLLLALFASLVIWFFYEKLGEEQVATLWLALLLLPFIALTALRQAALKSLRHVVKAVIPDSILRPALLGLLTLIVYYFVPNDIQATHVMALNVVCALIAFLIGAAWLVKALPNEVHKASSTYKGKEWLRVSLPLFLMSSVYLVLERMDILMIGSILGPEQAGIYAVASRVSAFAIFGMIAINAIAAPLISEFHSTGNIKDKQKTITLAARGMFLFALLIIICLLLWGDFALALFGESFSQGYLPLLILLIGHGFNAFCGPVGFVLTMSGHQVQAAWIIGGSAVINLFLNFLLIPELGIIGAAVATTVSTVVWNIAMMIYVWRKFSINTMAISRG